jgi:pimeloyl-ACP methyl ester carboxylesterase
MSAHRATYWLVVCALVVAGAVSRPAEAGTSAEPFAAPDNGRSCRASMLPVTVELGSAQVFARMCTPTGSRPRAVQLLVHGITYDHRYWNTADPAQPRGDRYSWEAAAARAGYATVAIDRLGAGRSSHPPSATVNLASNAAVVHQVVQQLRAGRVPAAGKPIAYRTVVLVGHSYGSMTAWTEADRFQDVDALVLTGATHNVREVHAPSNIEASMYPAVLDPRYAGTLLDPGYVTPRPGTVNGLFYAPGTDVDPRIIAADEQKKGTVSQFELLNYPVIFRTRLDLRVPVFLLVGDKDGIFCSQTPFDLGAPCGSPSRLVANERPWLGPRVPSVQAFVTAGAGHDLNNFRSSQTSFAAALRWLRATVRQ